MKESLLVATGDGVGEGVILEKSSNLLGECSLWAELPGSAGVSNDRTPKLKSSTSRVQCIMQWRTGYHSNAHLGASGVTAGGRGLPVM